jgi:magnesium transporter
MSRRRRHHHRKPPRIRKRTAPGAVPGTISVPVDATATNLHVIRFSADQLQEYDLTVPDPIRQWIKPPSVIWVNVNGLGSPATLEQLCGIFRLHSLALEDVVNTHQRTKIESYDDHLFIVLKMVSLVEHMEIEQVSMFLGDHFVLTIQERAGDCFEPVRERLRHGRGRIRKAGADYLAYALIDAVIDGYFPVVDQYGEHMEQLDERVSAGHSAGIMDEIHNLRSDLMQLRRSIRPLRDELNRLRPDQESLFSADTSYYLRDCYDHVVQITDLLDSYRELCGNLRDYYMSSLSNRMNDIMKVLTVIGTIFIPLSFIAGVYGMNFNTQLPGNMPELDWPYGYVIAWLIMLGTAGGLLAFIWRKGWLKSDGVSNSRDPRN